MGRRADFVTQLEEVAKWQVERTGAGDVNDRRHRAGKASWTTLQNVGFSLKAPGSLRAGAVQETEVILCLHFGRRKATFVGLGTLVPLSFVLICLLCHRLSLETDFLGCA